MPARVESGVVNKPSVQVMAKIAKALGVSMVELTNWKSCKMSSEQKV